MPKGIPANGINTGQFKKGQIPYNKGLKRPEMSGENNPLWNGGKRKKKCIVCGKEMLRDKCQIERAKFCSHSCKAKFNLTGEKQWKWKGGISKSREKLKGSNLYREWRLRVFQRDRFTCKLCGHRSRKSKAHGDKTSDIQAHHVETIEKSPKLCLKEGNGITLCINCHRLTYGKEEQFSKVFKEILNDYMPNNPKG